MCLGIPMGIRTIDGALAVCEAKGVEREVSLFLLAHETLSPGDFVLVHVGYAIQKITAEEARLTWELFDQMLVEADHV